MTGGYGDSENEFLGSTLDEVVIQTDEDPNKPSKGLIGKVDTVIPKTSSGKTPSEGLSRKASRNESYRRR